MRPSRVRPKGEVMKHKALKALKALTVLLALVSAISAPAMAMAEHPIV